jgi:radical SAM superfamily enzyme YgiQ (UPF0313 family)
MNVSLATSLHLNHGSMTPEVAPGDTPSMIEFVPLGLLSLKAAADAAGVGSGVRVTEVNGLVNSGAVANDGAFFENLADAVLRPGDDVLGLMTDADSLHHTVALAEVVKARSPHTQVWLGGPASTPIASEMLATFPALDAIVRGEGEATFVELLEAELDGRPPREVAGVTWRDGAEIVHNPDRPIVRDLDTLPLPAYDAYDVEAGADLYLDVGRGCPFKCDFCATAPFWDRTYRMKSIDRIVSEMVSIRDRFGRTHVNFSHDIFTANRRWTARFCDRLIDDPIGVTWTCSTRTDISTPELLEKMAAAGCVEIYYGIESGSPDIQRDIHKNLDLDWSAEIVRSTAAVGIRPVFGFIVGYPMETRDTLRATLERYFQFLRIGGVRGHLFTLCPFQQAPMYRRHADAARRPARDYVLPLTGSAASRCAELKASHRGTFSSTYRYESPGVAEGLVHASEEISAAMTVLRSVWPHLIAEYPSPLDWYERWVGWIEDFNRRNRPGTRTPQLGDARDMLAFVESEIERLGLEDEGVAEIVRYERLKLDAQDLPPAAAARTDGNGRSGAPESLGPATRVVRRCGYLAEPLRYDLKTLLDGQPGMPAESPRWVVLAKPESDRITTLQVGQLGIELLERSANPARLDDERLAPVASQLVERGLLEVAG